MDAPALTFADLLFIYANEKLAALKSSNVRLGHYTTAENGLNILARKSIWLRNALLMNDVSEIAHGRMCVEHALSETETGKRFVTILDGAFPGLWHRLSERWAQRRELAYRYTYVTSLSEIEDGDNLGRLSMWRAYGGPVGGVVIVFKNDILEVENHKLGAYHSPVLYADKPLFVAQFERIVSAIEAHPQILNAVDSESAFQVSYNALHFATLSTKHLGFAEEQEWRVIYSLDQGQSPWIAHDPEVVNGVPQVVCKIPLQNPDGLDMPELDLPNLIDRVLIGPCAYPIQVAEAYRKVMMDHGISQPRIDISTIPLRQ